MQSTPRVPHKRECAQAVSSWVKGAVPCRGRLSTLSWTQRQTGSQFQFPLRKAVDRCIGLDWTAIFAHTNVEECGVQ